MTHTLPLCLHFSFPIDIEPTHVKADTIAPSSDPVVTSSIGTSGATGDTTLPVATATPSGGVTLPPVVVPRPPTGDGKKSTTTPLAPSPTASVSSNGNDTKTLGISTTTNVAPTGAATSRTARGGSRAKKDVIDQAPPPPPPVSIFQSSPYIVYVFIYTGLCSHWQHTAKLNCYG
jgi:hypothetical protein